MREKHPFARYDQNWASLSRQSSAPLASGRPNQKLGRRTCAANLSAEDDKETLADPSFRDRPNVAGVAKV